MTIMGKDDGAGRWVRKILLTSRTLFSLVLQSVWFLSFSPSKIAAQFAGLSVNENVRGPVKGYWEIQDGDRRALSQTQGPSEPKALRGPTPTRLALPVLHALRTISCTLALTTTHTSDLTCIFFLEPQTQVLAQPVDINTLSLCRHLKSSKFKTELILFPPKPASPPSFSILMNSNVILWVAQTRNLWVIPASASALPPYPIGR